MNDILVGDEVRYVNGVRTFVVAFCDGARISGFNAQGDMFVDKLSYRWMKTGRHFPEMQELLAKIGGGDPTTSGKEVQP